MKKNMFEIIIPAVAGALIGFSVSAQTKKWKIIRLKSENIMLHERNAACSDENMMLISKIEFMRHECSEARRDVLLWESLAYEIARHPHPENLPVMQKVSEKGIQLLNHYKNQLK
jgi:hypothetical protein